MNIYDFSVPMVGGGELSLAENKGKLMLIVNTATGCGFTPQYEDLAKLYDEYHEKGLEVPSDEKVRCEWGKCTSSLFFLKRAEGIYRIWS